MNKLNRLQLQLLAEVCSVKHPVGTANRLRTAESLERRGLLEIQLRCGLKVMRATEAGKQLIQEKRDEHA